MKLFHGITSVCSVKVRIGLAEIGLDYEEEVLDLRQGDQFATEYLALNANGVVPTLVDGDLVVEESSLILEYLDREYNESRLMPKGRVAEVAARSWLLRCLSIHDAINALTFSTARRDKVLASKSTKEISDSVARMPSPTKRAKRMDLLENGTSSVHVEQALVTLKRCLSDMDSELRATEWMSGPQFGITDIALLAYIDRLERLGLAGMFCASWPRVSAWLAAMQARPSYLAEVVSRIDPKSAVEMKEAGSNHWPDLQSRWVKL